MKEAEESIEKSKLVILFGKLKALETEKEEKEQTLRSLTKHC